MSKKKTNPRRIPVTQADVNKAKKEVTLKITNYVWSIIFTVLRDKEGYDVEGLRRIWSEVEDLMDSVNKGYCTISDLKHILKIEEGVQLVQSPRN